LGRVSTDWANQKRGLEEQIQRATSMSAGNERLYAECHRQLSEALGEIERLKGLNHGR